MVTEEVDIQPNSLLDFGQRELRIENGGVLDFGEGEARVRCGKLVVDVDGDATAIRLTDTTPNAIARGSRIEAVGQCSGAPRACLTKYDCSLFECGGHRCEGAPTRGCTTDGDCNLGVCKDTGRCSGFESERCSSNADCHAGLCGSERTCIGSGDDPYTCTKDADCMLGECTAGDGSIDLGGTTDIDVVAGNDFAILAASDVKIRSPIHVEGDETRVNVESELGDLVLDAPIESHGARGTILLLLGGGDVTIDAPILADGESQGGWIVAIADKTLTVRDDLLATIGTPGAGLWDGLVNLESDLDLRIENGTAEDPIDIQAGAADLDPSARSGEVHMISGRDLIVSSHSNLRVNGNHYTALTAAAAGTLDLDANVEIRGANVDNGQTLTLSACSVRVGPEANVLNAAGGGGSLVSARNLLAIDDGAKWVCDGCTNLASVRPDTERRIAGDVDPAFVYSADDSIQPCGTCPTSSPCDDGDECTSGDACRGDVCRGRRDVECGDCGSSTIEWGEDCDDGDEEFLPGQACSVDCQWIRCGHPTGSTATHPKTSDALFTLRTSVGLNTCAPSVCDANQSNAVEASDALLVLRAAVGIEGVICPLPD